MRRCSSIATIEGVGVRTGVGRPTIYRRWRPKPALVVAALVADPELAQTYVSQYLMPRRAAVWAVLQRGVDRGELHADAGFAFVYDLLMGPLFSRAVIWGQPLAADAAEQTTDVILAPFGARPVV